MSPRKSVSVGLSLVCFSVVTGAVGLSAGAQTLTTLASLGGDAGAWAHGGVVADADGTLYGTAYGSGEGVGTIFELAASTHSLSQLGVFNGGNGANPEASLLLAPNGDLYGTSWGGGRYGQGTLFKLPAGSSTPVALYVAGDPTIGINPTSGLIADGNGNLYGTMTGGSDHLGSVFQFDPSTNTMTALATFSPGVNPDVHGHLWDDSAGNLYGTTASNGNSGGAGGIFKVDAATHTLTMLYSFNTYDGAFAQSGVIGDGKGNLYGTTTSGGTSNLGTVFQYNLNTHQLTTLVNFNGANGDVPYGALLLDSSGDLFGTTNYGGTNDMGTVFEINRTTHELTTLASFTGDNGRAPMGDLIFGPDASLYGTTEFGGANEVGTVFEVTVPEPSSGLLVTLSAAGILARRRRQKLR